MDDKNYEEFNVNGKFFKNFWRGRMRNRMTNTGFNIYTNRGYRPMTTKEKKQDYCNKLLIEMRRTIKPFTENEKKEYKMKFRLKNNDYFNDVVFECLDDIKRSHGYVFSKDQLEVVGKFVGFDNIEVTMDEYDTYKIKLIK